MTRAAQGPFEGLSDGLAGRLEAAGAQLLHRGRVAFRDAAAVVPLRALAALDLGPGRLVALVADAAGARFVVPVIDDGAVVRRAVAGDGVSEALVNRLGSLQDKVFRTTSWYAEPVTGERPVTVDQTDESVIVGGRAVVKWALRQPAAGAARSQPAADRLETLARLGFPDTARPWGLLRYAPEDLLVACVTEYLPGARDGWDWMVEDVRALARGERSWDDARAPAARIGRLTADLHLALATGGQEPATHEHASSWAVAAQRDLAEAVDAMDGVEGARLAGWADRIGQGLRAIAGSAGTPLIDVHGDLHVGQLLRHGEPPRYAVVDFDGSPVQEPAERTARRPAAVDVSGLLASIDHVGRVVLHRTPGVDADVVRRWIAAAERDCLQAYTSRLADAGARHLLDDRLLRPLRLHAECREYLYAARHLPHWRYVPDAALPALLASDDRDDRDDRDENQPREPA